LNIPLTLTAGDRWTWTDSLSDYPATLWTLTYYFRGPKPLDAAAGVASGTDHVVTIAAADTNGLKPGVYDWQARVALIATPTTIQTVEVGRLTVLPNLANAAVDNRSFNVRVTEALQATIEGRATTDQLAMSIAGRSLSRMSWDELLGAYREFSRLAASESGASPTTSYIRFERA
jgi:hypothetical protein